MRSSYRQPSLGEGFVSGIAVDRVLSYIACLRRSSSLFFIPLVPYPARFARHLPHAGKALSVGIVFPHMHVFALTMREKRYSRIVSLPHWGRGTASAVDRVFSQTAYLRRSLPTLFHTAFPIQPPPLPREWPHEPLPLEGAAERSEAGLASFWGGARVLSLTACLRRISPLSFIPLEPYPARSARHLPHAGKALCRE